MKQRISESILDDCPGVSENRKKILLRHFGIEKLKQATADEISALEGIGPKLAETIVDFFIKLKRRGPQIEDEQVGDLPEAEQTEPGVITYQLKPREN